MARPSTLYPGFARCSVAALAAESLAAHLHKADAVMICGTGVHYRRHLDRALARFDDLAAEVALIRAELENADAPA